MPITEQITWTLTREGWPEPGDDPLILLVYSYDEDGCARYAVWDGCTCYYDGGIVWFTDKRGNDIESHVAAWSPGPTGQPVEDWLCRNHNKPRNSLIPFESELS